MNERMDESCRQTSIRPCDNDFGILLIHNIYVGHRHGSAGEGVGGCPLFYEKQWIQFPIQRIWKGFSSACNTSVNTSQPEKLGFLGTNQTSFVRHHTFPRQCLAEVFAGGRWHAFSSGYPSSLGWPFDVEQSSDSQAWGQQSSSDTNLARAKHLPRKQKGEWPPEDRRIDTWVGFLSTNEKVWPANRKGADCFVSQAGGFSRSPLHSVCQRQQCQLVVLLDLVGACWVEVSTMEQPWFLSIYFRENDTTCFKLRPSKSSTWRRSTFVKCF